MELSSEESMSSRRSNKELAKSQMTSKMSSTKKLLLEAKLKAEIKLNEIMEREQETRCIKLDLKKKIIQTKHKLEKVKLRDKRELRDRNTEDSVHEEHNLSVTKKRACDDDSDMEWRTSEGDTVNQPSKRAIGDWVLVKYEKEVKAKTTLGVTVSYLDKTQNISSG
ncbi:hypothetical protein FQA39_LY13144 [Lamprigera yunnana]|nr:hypothetical protein FQA39_LY13144 [Lamprigera yunnana]